MPLVKLQDVGMDQFMMYLFVAHTTNFTSSKSLALLQRYSVGDWLSVCVCRDTIQIATPPTVFSDSHKTWHMRFMCQYGKKLQNTSLKFWFKKFFNFKFRLSLCTGTGAVELCRPTGLALLLLGNRRNTVQETCLQFFWSGAVAWSWTCGNAKLHLTGNCS